MGAVDLPTVLVDCDGPLADFVRGTLDLIFFETGTVYLPEEIRTWEIFESIADKELEKKVYDKIKSKGQCSALGVVPGGPEGIKRLQEISEVVIVTSPFHGSETWVYEREKWLAKHFNIDPEDIIHARKKFHVFGHFLVDDRPKHLELWSKKWPTSGALLWDTPGNRSDTTFPRVKTWDEVYDIVDSFRRSRAERSAEERKAEDEGGQGEGESRADQG